MKTSKNIEDIFIAQFCLEMRSNIKFNRSNLKDQIKVKLPEAAQK